MGNRTSGYGELANPDFSGTLSYHVQQEKSDGSLWSVTFFIDDKEQFASKRCFGTEAEARSYGDANLR